ncbi:MAG: 4Fe-4S binding protein [Dehalococcoidia bacterium]|nr:4Fe-4S binding protein [Dehalococcoidia bacterium]
MLATQAIQCTPHAGYEDSPKILPLSLSYATIQVPTVGSTVSKRKNIKIKIYKNWCKRCGICIAFCPKKALEADQDGNPSLKDNKTCTGCGLCELLCPDFAIVVNYDEDRAPSRK